MPSAAPPKTTPAAIPENAYTPLAPGEVYRPLVPASATPPELTPYSIFFGLFLCVVFTVATDPLRVRSQSDCLEPVEPV